MKTGSGVQISKLRRFGCVRAAILGNFEICTPDPTRREIAALRKQLVDDLAAFDELDRTVVAGDVL